MQTKCILGSQLSPKSVKSVLGQAQELKTYQQTHHGLGAYGIPLSIPGRRKLVERRDRPTYRERLRDWGEQIDLTASGTSTLHVVGTRKAILEMFAAADQSPQFIVANPPGIFVAVDIQERLFKKDLVTLCIASGSEAYYRKKNTVNESWHWKEITRDYLKLDGSGRYTVHPQAFVLPLKNIMDECKVG